MNPFRISAQGSGGKRLTERFSPAVYSLFRFCWAAAVRMTPEKVIGRPPTGIFISDALDGVQGGSTI